MKKILALLLISFFLFISFSSVSGTSEKSSYAASEWPQFMHDAMHTGKSSYSYSGSNLSVLWKHTLGQPLKEWLPVVGKNDTLYFVSNNSLYCLNQNGSLKYKLSIFPYSAGHSPAIDENGTIYLVSVFATPMPGMEPLPRYVYAVSREGKILWNIFLGRSFNDLSSPVLYKDRLYISSYGEGLYAISTTGKILWKLNISATTIPSVSPKGNIFVCSGKYIYSIDDNGSVNWKIEIGKTWWMSVPIIGQDGTIYVANESSYIYAITPNGSIKWKTHYSGFIPAIDNTRNSLYYAEITYSSNKSIISLNSINTKDGTLRWKKEISQTTEDFSISVYLAVDGDGTIYICGGHDYTPEGFLYAVSPDGHLIGHIALEGKLSGYIAPVLGKRAIYIGTRDGFVYAIKGPGNSHDNKNVKNYAPMFTIIVIAVSIPIFYYFLEVKRRDEKRQ